MLKKLVEKITGIQLGDKNIPQLFGDLHIHFHFTIRPPHNEGKRKDASKGN